VGSQLKHCEQQVPLDRCDASGKGGLRGSYQPCETMRAWFLRQGISAAQLSAAITELDHAAVLAAYTKKSSGVVVAAVTAQVRDAVSAPFS